jgi:O-succinylbenzoate synthase
VLPTPIGDVAVVRLPLRVRFRGLAAREAVLWRGPAGWAEFAPFTEYDDETAVTWFRAAVDAATYPWPAPHRASVPVNATVPAVPAVEVPEVLALYPGCDTVKVKVGEPGQAEADDLARLEAVRAAVGRGGRVRIDVNGAWSLDEAVAALPRYERAAGGLEYAEQPCSEVDDLAELRRRVDVPLAADESIRLGTDPRRAAEAVDVVVAKVSPLGGVAAVLRLAEQLDRPVVVSSALDTSVGLAAGVAAAASLPELPYACGLGTGALLARDVTEEPLVPRDGQVEVRRVVPAQRLLVELVAPDDRVAWWQRRLERVAELAA